ncbi:MAG: acyl carrier protein [Wenzhouxiangella sp.]|nr:acyl carrier protein [Wenzhouxiangella sp.]TVR98516.1 MAG: acyl carrier protein [Wenzhouxiangellaceae bacterium]
MNETRKRVDEAIDLAMAAALPELGQVDRDAALTGDLGLDSVQIMNLVMEIEDNLDVSVPVDILAEVRSLNQLADRLCALVGDT